MNGKFDTTLVKRPHLSEKYTTDQVEEIAKCIQDPIYFIGTYCSIQHPVKGRVKFDLFDFQKTGFLFYRVVMLMKACQKTMKFAVTRYLSLQISIVLQTLCLYQCFPNLS